MNFTQLHQQKMPLLLANVWDAASAQAAEAAGYQALGTSSAAIAAMYGYEDGEEISFSELFSLLHCLKKKTSLPLSVDMEAGYNTSPAQLVERLTQLAGIGIVGINLEDSVVVDGKRQLVDPLAFAQTLCFVRRTLDEKQIRLFLNIRSDPFLLGVPDALLETLHRGEIYSRYADGFFVPCMTQRSDIETIVTHIPLPLNVMHMPGLPAYSVLATLGVKRISMGNTIHTSMLQHMQKCLSDSYTTQFDNEPHA